MENKNSDYQPLPYYEVNNLCKGFSKLKDNCWNFSIISKSNSNVFENEYLAGFVQGKLQGGLMIMAARNNTWKNTYLCDQSHSFPQNIDPTENELKLAERCLLDNYEYTYNWIRQNPNKKLAINLKRLFFRMLGIVDGITYQAPLKSRTFESISPESLPELSKKLGLHSQAPTFLDIYFLNAQLDMFDVISNSLEATYGIHKSDHCSAFLKRTEDGDIYWTHNSWCGFLSQSHTITYTIGNENKSSDRKENIDFITQNSYCPGQLGSNMDFGFNGHGICFNETTHRYSALTPPPKAEGIWICWRAAVAEMFATSIDEFYEYITADNTGTYLNGYMLINVNTNETALIEMSRERFVFFRSNGGEYTVTDSLCGPMTKNDYDIQLLTPEFIFGVNYPISYNVARDLGSTDNRPMRRIQFAENISRVTGMESAKALITYIGKNNNGEDEPLSIYGRWDLGYGSTTYPKTIPDGAVDSKVFSAKKVKQLLADLRYEPVPEGGKTSFWMLYGTPFTDGKPFIWSESQWFKYKNDPKFRFDFVPDELKGHWNETNLFLD